MEPLTFRVGVVLSSTAVAERKKAVFGRLEEEKLSLEVEEKLLLLTAMAVEVEKMVWAKPLFALLIPFVFSLRQKQPWPPLDAVPAVSVGQEALLFSVLPVSVVSPRSFFWQRRFFVLLVAFSLPPQL